MLCHTKRNRACVSYRPSNKRVVDGQQGPQSELFVFSAGRYFNPGWGRVSTAWHFFRIQTQVHLPEPLEARVHGPIPTCVRSVGAHST